MNYDYLTVRESVILTTGYVAGTVLSSANLNPHEENQLMLYVFWTKGSLTSLEIKVEFSHDGTNYVQETFSTISTTTSTDYLGFHTATTTGNYRLAIPIKDKFIKVSAKGTGTLTGSSLEIGAIIGRT